MRWFAGDHRWLACDDDGTQRRALAPACSTGQPVAPQVDQRCEGGQPPLLEGELPMLAHGQSDHNAAESTRREQASGISRALTGGAEIPSETRRLHGLTPAAEG